MASKRKSDQTPSQEFLERKQLIELDRELSKEKHRMKMEEFAYLRESEKIKHDLELQRQRIKSAEIKRMQDRKMWRK